MSAFNASHAFGQDFAKNVREFFANHCYDCHTREDAEGGLDLETLPLEFTENNQKLWVRIHDRVRNGEMPPPDYDELSASPKQDFVRQSGRWIWDSQKRIHESKGRVRGRRLTNLQLENTLHDLLGIDIPLSVHMPDEPRTNGFNNIASGQSLSHFQLEEHLKIVDLALDNAFERAVSKPLV